MRSEGGKETLANAVKISTGGAPFFLMAEEETFGPAAFIFPFSRESEVIAAANNTIFGLASYAYTEDASRQWRLLERLEYGMVGINTPSVSLPSAPFGGVKQSGLGREGSHHGLTDFLDIKTAHIGIRPEPDS